MVDLYKLFRPLSMRLASGDEKFALKIANQYVSAIEMTYQWLNNTGMEISTSEIEDFAYMVESLRLTTPLVPDGKQRLIKDHYPKNVVENRIWKKLGEHNILSMRLAKPQVGGYEIFFGGAIEGAYLTNASTLKGDVITPTMGIENKEHSTNFIKMINVSSYIEHGLHILACKSVSDAPGARKPSYYKLFPAKDYLKYMDVVDENTVKFKPFV